MLVVPAADSVVTIIAAVASRKIVMAAKKRDSRAEEWEISHSRIRFCDP